MAINQRKKSLGDTLDNGQKPASYVDGDPTRALRASTDRVRTTPQGETDQSDGPGSQLDTDRHQAVKTKSSTIRRAGAGGVAI